MTVSDNNNILGFYASFHENEQNENVVKSHLWDKGGLKDQTANLKWKNYGNDIEIILFEFYVNPIPYLKKNLKEIGNYRRKEKSIGIPIILENQHFFKLSHQDQLIVIKGIIKNKLELLKVKVKRNKLDCKIDQLIEDVKFQLNYDENEFIRIAAIEKGSDLKPNSVNKPNRINILDRILKWKSN